MGRFNGRCEYLSGIASGPLAIDGYQIGRGSGRWLDDETVIANATVGEVDAHGELLFHTFEFARSRAWAPVRLDERGASFIGAGGGNWAATLAARTGLETFGMWKGTPLSLDGLRVLDGGRDGTLLFATTDFQHISALWPDGNVDDMISAPNFLPDQVRAIDGGFIYMNSQLQLILGLRDLPPVAIPTFDTPFEPYSFVRGGKRWVFYHNTRIVLHEMSAADGHVFPAGFHPDICPSVTRIAYARNEEALDALEFPAPFVLGDGTQDLVPAVTIPAIPAINHPVLITVVKDPDGLSPAPCEIVVNQTAQSVKRPFFAAEDSLAGPFVGDLLGIYSEAVDPSAVVQVARQRNTRLLLGHDSANDWTIPKAVLRPWDIPMIELYLLKNESTQQSVTRWLAQGAALLKAWPGDCGVMLMLYCGGGAPPNELFAVQTVLDALPLAIPVINLSARMKVVGLFAIKRINGATGHPELMEVHRRIVAAAPGVATLLPVGQSPVPLPGPDVPPTPAPAPSPTPVPTSPIPPATNLKEFPMKMRARLKGKYIGVDPSAPTKVYADRAVGGGWETFDLAPSKAHPDMFIATFESSQRVLSQQPDGSFATRPAGTDGGYEQFFATNQPDGSALLYRFNEVGALLNPVLQLEAVA